MSRKTFKGYWHTAAKADKYQWEFKRRNKEYGRDLIRLKQLWLRLASIRPTIKMAKKYSSLFDRVANESDKFAEKWGFISRMDCMYPSPENNYSSLTEDEKLTISSPATNPDWLYITEYVLSYYKSRGRINLFPGRANIDKKIRSLTLKINLNYPLERIMQEVGLIVKNLKGLRTSKGLEKETRPRLDGNYYDQCLKVYDTWDEHKKWTWLHIGQKAFPILAEKVKENGPEFLIQKTKRAFDTCKGLINGGYKDTIT